MGVNGRDQLYGALKNFSGLLLLLPRSGKEDIVQDQTIACRIRVQAQVRGRIAHHMLIVLGVVATIELSLIHI